MCGFLSYFLNFNLIEDITSFQFLLYVKLLERKKERESQEINLRGN